MFQTMLKISDSSPNRHLPCYILLASRCPSLTTYYLGYYLLQQLSLFNMREIMPKAFNREIASD